MKKTITLILSLFTFFYLTVHAATAQITNPAVVGPLGSDPVAASSGATFTSYFVYIWRAVIFVGALMVLVYFLWGGIEWITAGGDQSKVGKARDRITQSMIGLVILVASFSIIGLLSQVFFGDSFNLLELTIPTAATLGGAAGTVGGGAGSGGGSGSTVPPNIIEEILGIIGSLF